MQILADIAMWAGAGVGVAALLTVAYKAWQGIRRVSHFLDDWFGEEPRPGVPARPGVMERLDSVEQDVASIKVRVGMEGAA